MECKSGRGYLETKCIESEIKCPYCGYLWQDSGEHNTYEHEWSDIIECPECEKKFHAEQCVMVDYRTSKDCELNGEEHKFVKAIWKDTVRQCEKCGFTLHEEVSGGSNG